MVHHRGLVHADYHLDVRGVAAVDDIFGGEQVGGGNRYGAELVERQESGPELVPPLEHQHHGIPLADSRGPEYRGGLVRKALQVGVGEGGLGALLVAPDEGALVAARTGELVHDVVREVEGCRGLEGEAAGEILVGGEFDRIEKSLYHFGFLLHSTYRITARKRARSPPRAFMPWGSPES
jgi:hypothetical protein